MTKYLIHIGICGFGNQLLGFKEACIIAKMTNRTIVLPYFIPHGTIRESCNHDYHFNEIFDETKFNFCDSIHFDKIKHQYDIKRVYYNRHKNDINISDSYFNISKDIYNLKDVEKVQINKTFIRSYDDFVELQNIQDDVLVLVGTFNSVKLSSCNKNGCINKSCIYNDTFKEIYNDITRSIVFNNTINHYANTMLNQLGLIKNNYCVFHLRILDLCKNKSFEYCYNNYTEVDVYQSIKNYLFEIKRTDLVDKIFLMAPPDFLKINNISLFNDNTLIKRLDYDNVIHDKFILSIIELCICENSNVMISSPTNTPNEIKQHTRSSFTLHSKELRNLGGKKLFDTCISDIYNKNIITHTFNVKDISNKKIISFCLYNDKDIYNYGVFMNYELHKYIYPEWIIRIYVDKTMNSELLNNIITNYPDIEVIMVESNISPMYYRFLPINDKNVEFFISRDLDSIIGFKEETMVNEWLNSDKTLHLIHEVLPGHRHNIMAGMMGFKNNNNANNNITDFFDNKLKERDVFYYDPFYGKCVVIFENNSIVIHHINNRSKSLTISNDNLNMFYEYKYIKVIWCGCKNKLIDCKLEPNGDIIVHPNGPQIKYLFKKQYTNNNINILNHIYNYHYRLKRDTYLYLDEQNWLNEYMTPYLCKNKCIDHNIKNIWDYSVIFKTPFKKLDSLFFKLNEHFVGHRVDTKTLYETHFTNSWKSKKKKICLLLTTTINTHDVEFNNQANPTERLNIYLNKINKWLRYTNLNIVVVENSNYTLSEVQENNDRFEKIIFDITNINNEIDNRYLNNTKGKGQYESYSINYAYTHSKLLQSADFIIKVTGRFFVPNLEKILLEQLNNKPYKFIRQVKPHKCEIVGCHRDNFAELFKFPLENNHAETSYQTIINRYNTNEVLTLPILSLDDRTIIGNGCYYDKI
jgi:hypothetical protein